MQELFKQNDRITISGKVYYINRVPSADDPEYLYYQLKTIYGDTLEFNHADLPLPTETDQAFNRINHGMEEFMVQDIMSAKKNYMNFYGIYKESLYRLTAITRYAYSEYAVWNKKSDVAHHFPKKYMAPYRMIKMSLRCRIILLSGSGWESSLTERNWLISGQR